MSRFVITREQSGSVNGAPRTGRTFVTGPYFGQSIYSSTGDIAEASRYSREEAERLVAVHWRHLRPEIESVDA